MTSTPTAIDFPDPNEPGFDESVPFEAPNGNSYLWNGYGWELVCEGDDGGFLKRHGDDVDDAPDDVYYTWNKSLTFHSDAQIDINTEKKIFLNSDKEVESKVGDDSAIFATPNAVEMGYKECLINCSKNYTGTHPYKVLINAGNEGEILIGASKEIRIGADNGSGGRNLDIIKVEGDNNKGYYTGLIEDNESLVNKQYVDTLVTTVQEEIEAITPTVQTGIWQDGNSASPGTGHFAMRLGNGSITQDYTDTTIVTLIISTTDKGGTVHTFDSEEVGDEIQLFDVEDQNFGLFKIDAIDNTDPNYVQFTVTHLRGLGSTHVDDDVLIRTFKPVTSGDGTAYLLKNGEYVDPPSAVTFEWTKNVEFVTKNSTVSIENNWVDITSKNIQLLGKGGGKIFLQSEGKIELEAETTLKIYSKTSDVTLVAGGNEVIYRDIDDTDPPEQIVNKQYVDSLFDFSQYDPLP